MKSQNLILAAITLASLLAACNANNRQTNPEDSTQTAPTETDKNVVPVDKLVGKWVQPIPGQETKTQGIQLNSNGSASSINMHTLIYEKWELKGDTLILWNHTTGVKTTGQGVDTTYLKQLTDTTLTLTDNRGMEYNYTREK